MRILSSLLFLFHWLDINYIKLPHGSTDFVSISFEPSLQEEREDELFDYINSLKNPSQKDVEESSPSNFIQDKELIKNDSQQSNPDQNINNDEKTHLESNHQDLIEKKDFRKEKKLKPLMKKNNQYNNNLKDTKPNTEDEENTDEALQKTHTVNENTKDIQKTNIVDKYNIQDSNKKIHEDKMNLEEKRELSVFKEQSERKSDKDNIFSNTEKTHNMLDNIVDQSLYREEKRLNQYLDPTNKEKQPNTQTKIFDKDYNKSKTNTQQKDTSQEIVTTEKSKNNQSVNSKNNTNDVIQDYNISKDPQQKDTSQEIVTLEKPKNNQSVNSKNNTNDVMKNSKTTYEDSDLKIFIENELKMLYINHDIVLGKITEKYKVELMDYNQYIKQFWEKYEFHIQNVEKRTTINNFIANYYKYKTK